MSSNVLKLEIFYSRPNKDVKRQASHYQIKLKENTNFEKDFIANFSYVRKILEQKTLCKKVDIQIVPCRSI
jgi:hypothetical protein